jgi:hypothetical protein
MLLLGPSPLGESRGRHPVSGSHPALFARKRQEEGGVAAAAPRPLATHLAAVRARLLPILARGPWRVMPPLGSCGWWSQWLVVRQVTGESLFQGLLGGAVGVLLGLAGGAAIAALAPSLKATVATANQALGNFPGPFGQGRSRARRRASRWVPR